MKYTEKTIRKMKDMFALEANQIIYTDWGGMQDFSGHWLAVAIGEGDEQDVKFHSHNIYPVVVPTTNVELLSTHNNNE